MRDSTRDVRAFPVRGRDGSVRGWVRLDADRVGHANQVEFCITIDTTSYPSPHEAREFAAGLIATAALADEMLNAGKSWS